MYLGKRPRVKVVPIFSGGGQERGIRSGTVPTPLVVGLGAACKLAGQEMEVKCILICLLLPHNIASCVLQYDHKWINFLSQRLLDKITSNLDLVIRNGDPIETYPGTILLHECQAVPLKKIHKHLILLFYYLFS